MPERFDNAVITEIRLAIRVEPWIGKKQHADRASHGLVLNDADTRADYVFSDGTVLHTREWSVFYLPKHSTYRVVDTEPSACWAVNFETLGDIGEKPFLVQFRAGDPILDSFRQCVDAFNSPSEDRYLMLRRNLYDILLRIRTKAAGEYAPNRELLLIRPAVEYISRHFAEPRVSMSDLAGVCRISESYLRSLFQKHYGIPPKEYLLRRRIRYAQTLLSSGQFPIQAVAEMCGFGSPCHFSREFSGRVGLSPKAYREARQSRSPGD